MAFISSCIKIFWKVIRSAEAIIVIKETGELAVSAYHYIEPYLKYIRGLLF